VINYDLPQVAEDFIHRMGRTGRAGATGSAVSFISPQDGRKWHAIERLLNPNETMKKNDNNKKDESRSKKRKSYKNRHRNKHRTKMAA
jgi:ATP-dependent RNA helicase DeaD